MTLHHPGDARAPKTPNAKTLKTKFILDEGDTDVELVIAGPWTGIKPPPWSSFAQRPLPTRRRLRLLRSARMRTLAVLFLIGLSGAAQVQPRLCFGLLPSLRLRHAAPRRAREHASALTPRLVCVPRPSSRAARCFRCGRACLYVPPSHIMTVRPQASPSTDQIQAGIDTLSNVGIVDSWAPWPHKSWPNLGVNGVCVWGVGIVTPVTRYALRSLPPRTLRLPGASDGDE